MYKPYTGKVSSEYQVLGRLKPDLNTDELNHKRANLERVKMFSRNLRVINRKEELEIQARKAEAEKAGAAASSPPREPTKQERAREYAKRVPKPRAAPRQEGEAEQAAGGAQEGPAEELDALALLEKQHAEHVRQAAAIRAELGL